MLNEKDTKYLEITKNIIGKYQLVNFIGYNDKDNNRGGVLNDSTTWEDIVPTVSWNGKMFEYLTNLENSLDFDQDFQSVLKFSWNYIYYESKKIVLLFSIAPIKSIALLVYKKKNIKPMLSLNLIES